ncbi:type VII secretion system-associated protein [Streptomyces sp. NPDC056224]|uniref:type VII secretion system-associated protein n=1 Tax=Streptomyces sp. NPDC056224 TaxID=3345750 RepID=UPI0035DA1EBB
MADLTHLDAKGLQSFVDNDVADFIKELKGIRQDAPNGKALRSAIVGKVTDAGDLGHNKFLVIGGMATESEPSGKVLLDAITSGAKAIDDVLVAQLSLFKHLDANLTETIKTLLKTQGDSLTGIGAEKLLGIFSDVGGGPGSTARPGASAP